MELHKCFSILLPIQILKKCTCMAISTSQVRSVFCLNYMYLSYGTRVHMFLVVLNDSRYHFTLICWKVHLMKF